MSETDLCECGHPMLMHDDEDRHARAGKGRCTGGFTITDSGGKAKEYKCLCATFDLAEQEQCTMGNAYGSR